MRLKKVKDQVMVITGDSSGIGLVTARMAARRGAKLVFVSRNEAALKTLCEELRHHGCHAIYVVADVSEANQTRAITEAAILTFGGFDTWVNNASVGIYSRLDTVSEDDHRRLFEVNYWGLVHGSLEAIEHLRLKGGALINIGSVLSDRAIPLQGPYCASKFAAKAFTETLRMEMEKERAPISISLIKPGPIDTPYADHAKNYLLREATNMPPVYAPQTVAKAILVCATKPVRDVYVGGYAKFVSVVGQFFPRLTDKLMEKTMFQGQMRKTIDVHKQSNLYQPMGRLEERGDRHKVVLQRSLYTALSLRPARAALLVASSLIGFALLRARQREKNNSLDRAA